MSTDSEKFPGIKFIHMRLLEVRLAAKEGEAEIQPASQGGTTVAYKIEGTTVTFACASCHPDHDNYNRAQGRVKSAGRLNSPRFARNFPYTGDIKSPELLKEIEKCVHRYLNDRRVHARYMTQATV